MQVLKKCLMQCLLLSCFLVVSGCGFHLQRNALPLGKKYPTIILIPSGSNTLYQALRRAFIASGIQVLEQASDRQLPQLQVMQEELKTQPLVYGPDGELRRERLRMVMTFSFTLNATEEVIMATERDRQLNSKQHLGDNAEKIIIEREMQADIIQQLLTYLDRKKQP